MKRSVLERQAVQTKEKLALRVAQLKDKGVAEDAMCSDPDWRSLDAKRRQVITRLGAVTKVEERDAAVVARREGGEAEGAESEE